MHTLVAALILKKWIWMRIHAPLMGVKEELQEHHEIMMMAALAELEANCIYLVLLSSIYCYVFL
ncbi:hypothetical protein C1H46_007139 [Malus baccata]|uniref:Uncharacterized protein n=2 Tax=Malus TaxID=3749 RepID=A0A540N894_MALBA|nr:hypothetical protein C1H46_007139 [Malus baccata]